MTIFWGLVAAAGAVAFLTGARSGDPRAVWSIYLVNLVFWAGLAVTGPAIAAMMQLTEARWSPSVRSEERRVGKEGGSRGPAVRPRETRFNLSRLRTAS